MISITAQLRWWAVCATLSMAYAAPLDAQRREFVGPGKCTDCHDHKDEKEWSEKRDGDGKGKQHLNALNQLADKEATKYAAALKIPDVYDPKSVCVKCHATVVRGSADFGVSCESCHGAGKDYLKPHQEKGAYQASLPLGLKDYLKKQEAWARECVTCHVLGDNPTDAALIQAGHSSGSDFNLGEKYKAVSLHWTNPTYTANQIAGIGRPLRDALVAKLKPPTPAAAPTPTSAPPVPTAAPVSVPPPAPAPAPAAPTPTAPPAASPAPTPVPVAASTPVPLPAATAGNNPRPAPAGNAPAAPAPARAAAVPPSPPPALLPPPPPPPSPVIALDSAVPPSPAALVGAVQGRVAQLLTDLLTRGVRTPVKLTAPATKTPYRGADAELLQLQEEVIALALEALGTNPPPKPVKQQ